MDSNGDDLDRDGVAENIDLSPADSAAAIAVKEGLLLVATLGASLVSPVVPLAPMLVEIFKSVANVLGFLGQRRKAERVRDLLHALYERLQSTRSEYFQKEEFQDLFEEVLRRTAEQPEPARRESMRRVFLKIVEEPREHIENRLLLRLTDELPSESLKILAVLDRSITPEERAARVGHYALAVRLARPPRDLDWSLKYLVNVNLIDGDSFNVAPGIGAAGDNLLFLLTPLGRTFVEYMHA